MLDSPFMSCGLVIVNFGARRASCAVLHRVLHLEDYLPAKRGRWVINVTRNWPLSPLDLAVLIFVQNAFCMPVRDAQRAA